MVCIKCGAVLPESAKFCGRCGAKVERRPLKRHCRSCGAELAEKQLICTKCGMRFHDGQAGNDDPSFSEKKPGQDALKDAVIQSFGNISYTIGRAASKSVKMSKGTIVMYEDRMDLLKERSHVMDFAKKCVEGFVSVLLGVFVGALGGVFVGSFAGWPVGALISVLLSVFNIRVFSADSEWREEENTRQFIGYIVLLLGLGLGCLLGFLPGLLSGSVVAGGFGGGLGFCIGGVAAAKMIDAMIVKDTIFYSAVKSCKQGEGHLIVITMDNGVVYTLLAGKDHNGIFELIENKVNVRP